MKEICCKDDRKDKIRPELGMGLKRLNPTLDLRKLLVALVLLYMAAVAIGSVFVQSNPLSSGVTILLSLGIGAVLLIAVQFSKDRLFQQIVVVTFFFLIFVLPRIITYLFAPRVVVWPFGENITASTINVGLLYVLLGTALFLAGMWIADVIFRSHPLESSSPPGGISRCSTGAVLILFLVLVAMELYVVLVMKISLYGKMRAATYNTLFQLVRAGFELDSAFFFVVATLFLNQRMNNKGTWKTLVLVVLCYVVLTTLIGSRAGALRVLTVLTLTLTVIYSNFRFRLSRFLTTMLLLGMLGVAAFPLATERRLAIRASYRGHRKSRLEEEKKAERERTRELGALTACILNRLGVVDYAILIVTQEGDPDAKERYMNFRYPAMIIVNQLVPGAVFPEAKVMTSRVVDVIYRGGDEVGTYERHFSEYWTIWGLSYVYFGWPGGLVAILFVGFFVHCLYALIVKLSPVGYQPYLGLWLLCYVTMGVIGNMGFDNSFTTILFGLLQFTVLYFCLFLINFVHRSFGSLLKQTVEV